MNETRLSEPPAGTSAGRTSNVVDESKPSFTRILWSKFNGVVRRNPKRWAIFAAVCVLAIIGAATDNGNADSSGGSSQSSYGGSSRKSARQLIRERAAAIYGPRVDVTINSGFYGGAYQVTVSDNEHFHNYTIAVTVDEGNQAITSWESKRID